MSYSSSSSESFTLTNAKYLSSKVAADLKRIQRYYGKPSDDDIDDYEFEMIELLLNGYLEEVTYGFQRNDKWIEPTLIYKAKNLVGSIFLDEDPGRISAGADTQNATFNSYLNYSESWRNLSEKEKITFKKKLPFFRKGASKPKIDGRIVKDHTYTSGSKSLNRSSIKKY